MKRMILYRLALTALLTPFSLTAMAATPISAPGSCGCGEVKHAVVQESTAEATGQVKQAKCEACDTPAVAPVPDCRQQCTVTWCQAWLCVRCSTVRNRMWIVLRLRLARLRCDCDGVRRDALHRQMRL